MLVRKFNAAEHLTDLVPQPLYILDRALILELGGLEHLPAAALTSTTLRLRRHEAHVFNW